MEELKNPEHVAGLFQGGVWRSSENRVPRVSRIVRAMKPADHQSLQ